MNVVMFDGKKLVVEKIVYGVFDIVVEKIGKVYLDVFEEVFDNICFIVEVKFCCVGGLIY